MGWKTAHGPLSGFQFGLKLDTQGRLLNVFMSHPMSSSPAAWHICYACAPVSVSGHHDNPHSWGLISLSWALVKENGSERNFLWKLHSRLLRLERRYTFLCMWTCVSLWGVGRASNQEKRDKGRREKVERFWHSHEFSLSSRMFCRKCSKVWIKVNFLKLKTCKTVLLCWKYWAYQSETLTGDVVSDAIYSSEFKGLQ